MRNYCKYWEWKHRSGNHWNVKQLLAFGYIAQTAERKYDLCVPFSLKQICNVYFIGDENKGYCQLCPYGEPNIASLLAVPANCRHANDYTPPPVFNFYDPAYYNILFS